MSDHTVSEDQFANMVADATDALRQYIQRNIDAPQPFVAQAIFAAMYVLGREHGRTVEQMLLSLHRCVSIVLENEVADPAHVVRSFMFH